MEHVRSILEGSSELGRVNSQFHSLFVLVHDGIVLNGRRSSIHSPVNESSIGSVSIRTQIGDGDVVSDTQDAVAVVVFNARKFLLGRKSPVVVGGESNNVSSISQVIVTSPGSLDAIRSRDSERRDFGPGQGSISGRFLVASSFGVGSSLNSVSVSTVVSRLDVLRFGSVEIAVGSIVGQDGDISPGGRSPVRVVVSFFGAFETTSITVVVLSSASRIALVEVSIIDPQSTISSSGSTSLVIFEVLVKGIKEVSIAVYSNGTSFVSSDTIGRGSVTNTNIWFCVRETTHVLDDEVAHQFAIRAATMLVRPFHLEKRTFIVGHSGSQTVATFGIVLRIPRSVVVLVIHIRLVVSVIRTTRIVHVKVTSHKGHA